ncbi:unnamed protein product [Rotaria sordida]|uniref:Uncharacterized protein n=2 Tax=Rotaria sordida TaxID=392033 RepID=A0A813SXL6_9BILA|nr:unnamed protein product [Rotaria sordida]CAF0912734.1 unnamed protein product [Rotaria sordida]
MNLRRSIITNNQTIITKMHTHHPTTRSSSTTLNELMKKTPSPRRQTTRSTSNINKDNLTSTNIQVIKPVAVRPPSSDSIQNPYNLRSRTKLKNCNIEVIPSFTEKLSLDTPQHKPVPPLTRAAAASAGVKIDSFIHDESIKTSSNNNNKISINSQQSTRSSTTRKRKASEDDHRPHLDLLKMKQMTRRADQDCIGGDDEDSGCDYDSPAHSPVDFTDVPPGHVLHFEESNMSYDSGFSAGSGEANNNQQSLSEYSQTCSLLGINNSGISTRSSSNNIINSNKYPAAIDLDVNAIEGDLGF